MTAVRSRTKFRWPTARSPRFNLRNPEGAPSSVVHFDAKVGSLVLLNTPNILLLLLLL